MASLIAVVYFNVKSICTINDYEQRVFSNLIYKLVYLHIIFVIWRMRVYLIWALAEGSIACTGLELKAGSEKEMQPRLLLSVDIIQEEFQVYSFRTLVNRWNIRVQEWISQDIYIRLLDLIGAKYNERIYLLVFLLSSLWHGIYPGYICAFLTCAIALIAEKRLWKKFLFKYAQLTEQSWMVRTGRIILMHILVDYIMGPFLLLKWDRSIQYWSEFYYYGHILLAILLLAF